MYLNFSAGRSVNDIGQYPVFPWTVIDMTSETINLENEQIYRKMSLPIAAVNTKKLKQALERAEHMPIHERFLFGSFYSNPAFVLYFLIRKFPECHLRLHGGHFDHTARLFTSLQTSWEAVAESGSATMELIPVFYSNWDHAKDWLESNPSMPPSIPPVSLPPGANGSAKDFIVMLRCALESQYVSQHLHEWIDLVFGVKSRGKQICYSSKNLFHPICYLTDVTGDVIEYCKENDTGREVVVLQSQEFGHVPKQLFPTEPHVERNMEKWRKEWTNKDFYNIETQWRDEIFGAIEKVNKATVMIEPPRIIGSQAAPPTLTVKQPVGRTLLEFTCTPIELPGTVTAMHVLDKDHVVMATSRGDIMCSKEKIKFRLSLLPISSFLNKL